MALYIKELEDQLFEVHKFVERMVLRRRDFGSSLGELGLTLITMGTHEEKVRAALHMTGEEEAATTSKSFHDLGRLDLSALMLPNHWAIIMWNSCCDHLAINIQEQVKDEMEKTVFVLEEWLRIMEGAKVLEALRVHGATVAQWLALMSEYEKKDRALKQGVPQGKATITESDVNEVLRVVKASAGLTLCAGKTQSGGVKTARGASRAALARGDDEAQAHEGSGAADAAVPLC
eukprot:452613-Hanusia_phi.AAC.10